jgi:hypothetical protein
MFHVGLKEVPLEADVFCLLVDQGVLRVSNCDLLVLLDGGCSVDGFVEDLPHKLAKVESLLCSNTLPRKWNGRRMYVFFVLQVTTPRPSVNK